MTRAGKPPELPRLLNEAGNELWVSVDVAICAAGKGKRWNTNTPQNRGPKCLATFDGEPNLARTVRLLRGWDKWNFQVSIPEPDMYMREELFVDLLGAKFFYGESEPEKYRFLNFDGMCRTGTVFLYGDVRYTEGDLKKLLDAKPGTFLLRPGGNPLTRKPYGEVFGFVLNEELARRIDKLPDTGKAWDLLGCPRPRWQKARSSYVYTPEPQFPLIHAQDLTDDYDTWQEYLALRKVWSDSKAR